jgi:hypothetical protein
VFLKFCRQFGPNFVVFCCLKVIFLLSEVIFLLTGLCQCRPPSVSLCPDPLWPVCLLRCPRCPPFPFAIFRPWAFLVRPFATTTFNIFSSFYPCLISQLLSETVCLATHCSTAHEDWPISVRLANFPSPFFLFRTSFSWH